MNIIKRQPMIMIVIGVIGISLSSIFVRYSAAPSSVTAMYRLVWTVLLMSPVVLGRKDNQREIRQMSRKNLLLSALSGFFLAMHFWLWFESLLHTTVASSTTIVCTEVVWVALGYCLFMKGRLSKKSVLAIGVTLAGSIMIAWSDSASGGAHLYGDVLAGLSAVAVAVYTLIGRAVRKDASTTAYTYVVYLVCAVTLTVVTLAQGVNPFAYDLSAPVVGLLLAVFSTILGHSIFSWCLKYFSPSFVSASKLCEPVVAAALAGVLFGELPTPLLIAGGALILGGVLWYSVIEQKECGETEA